jgi:hypothetical protein
MGLLWTSRIHIVFTDVLSMPCFAGAGVPVIERLCPCSALALHDQRGIIAVPNDGDRGELYAELERACDELDKTLDMLKKAGYTLREFSKVLEADPTGILVTHYPTGYMIYPDEINKTPWEYPSLRPVVDLDYLVELLKRARQLKRAKMEIERRLGKRLVPLS